MIDEIQKHFENEYPREGCGILAIVKGKKQFFPCRNVAEDQDDFIISYDDYFNVKLKADIIGIVHNHIDASNEPSAYDIENCNHLGIPYYIFSYPEMDLNILQPQEVSFPLIGREYSFGVRDCFEAMRDWLKKENIEIPPRDAFEDNWWHKETGQNYFSEENIKKWNHIKVDSPKVNDVLIFQFKSDVPNHCGVYLGNDVFYHHFRDRLSCRESLYPLWHKYLVGVYRYEA